MYYEDLTPYEYVSNGSSDGEVLNVGWLDEFHEFSEGEVDSSILDQIAVLCFESVNQMRGTHHSPFADDASGDYKLLKLNGKEMWLGSSEIRVKGRSGTVYAAPNLIYHYIKDCGYLPPTEFVSALKYMSEQKQTPKGFLGRFLGMIRR